LIIGGTFWKHLIKFNSTQPKEHTVRTCETENCVSLLFKLQEVHTKEQKALTHIGREKKIRNKRTTLASL
jgi:hypothetical protein